MDGPTGVYFTKPKKPIPPNSQQQRFWSEMEAGKDDLAKVLGEGTSEVSEGWLNPKWKWGNPASRPTYGHSFLDHGKKVTDRQLIDRARTEGHQIGKWLDDQVAADFVAEIAKRGPGAHYVDLPSNVKGRCFLPDGTEIVPDRAIVVVKKDGSLTTCYPYSSMYPTTKPK
ncbi:hypothetical protein PAECIP111890_06279 [Paenibacillus sp. JJ-223]|nr:hypothetical protein PAECIP111890_06279 [Paenibacillus sp. JJ-223]